METTLPNIIQIGTVETLFGIAVILISGGIAWGILKRSVSNIETDLKEIKPDLRNVRERFAIVEDRVETIWKEKFAEAHSPLSLNPRGKDILEKSGIKEIIDEKESVLLGKVRERDPKNAYDAEEITLNVARNLTKHCPEVIDGLKDGAYSVGADLDTVLFVGGMYLRDKIFPTLGFGLGEIDEHKPKVGKDEK